MMGRNRVEAESRIRELEGLLPGMELRKVDRGELWTLAFLRGRLVEIRKPEISRRDRDLTQRKNRVIKRAGKLLKGTEYA